MVDSLQISKLHKKLGYFFENAVDVEIIQQLMQHPYLTPRELQKHLNNKQKSVSPYLYRRLKILSNQGWITAVGTHPLKYALIDEKIFREKLNGEIEKSISHLEAQKNSYYDIVTILDAIQSEVTGKSPNKFSYHTIPPQASESARTFIESIQNNSRMQIFNGEYGITIALNNERRQFRLTSLEFIQETGDFPLFGGIFISEVHPESNLERILDFLQEYHINALKFRYKLESKGYLEEKIRKLSQYSFLNLENATLFPELEIMQSKMEKAENILEISLSNHNFTGLIVSFPNNMTKNSAEDNSGPCFITVWGENQEIFKELCETVLSA